MWGGSVFGYTQWAIADQSNPGPSALHIQISSTHFYDMFYPGGAFSLESALFWAARSHGPQDTEPDLQALRMAYQDFPLTSVDDRAVGDVLFFNDWVTHHQRDNYWNAIDGENRASTLTAPVFLMAGWYDPFLPSQINDFLQIRATASAEVAQASRLVIGAWTHADTVILPEGLELENYRKSVLGPSIPWFDKHLKSLDDAESTAPVRIFVMGDNVWRDEQEWPLRRTQYNDYFLGARTMANSLEGDGQLTLASMQETQLFDQFNYDPRQPVPTAGGAMLGPRAGIALQNDIENRNDVLVYTAAPLTQNLEATGPVKVVLFVSTTVPNTDFTAKLVDVFPDGRAINVSDGILRRDYPGDAIHNPIEITIELWPISRVFKAGHQIRLEISSSNYPRYDRNPNTGGDIATEIQPVTALQTVYHDDQHPSRLILPVIPR